MRQFSIALLSIVLLGQACGDSSAQLIASSNIDEICRIAPNTSRKTVIYVDLASLRPNETEWGLTILNKLELSPRETLTVLGVNPDNFEINEAFESCYPTLSVDELSELKAKRGAFDKLFKLDPDNQQRENIQTFETRLRSVLNKIADASAKLKMGKRRNVLGAISVDKNRFRDTKAFYRVIVYTEGALVDSAISDEKSSQAMAEKYPTAFSGAEVFVYGIKGDKDRPIEDKEKLFAGFFISNWGWVRSFAPSLPQQKSDLLQPTTVLKGSFEGGGGKGPVALSFSALKDGSIEEGWITFYVGTGVYYVPFKGTYSCNDEDCKISGGSLESVPVWSATPFFRKNDKLELGGKAKGELQGSLRPATKEIFKGGPNEVQYTLRVRAE